jgi:hypothetical protein
MSTLVLSEQFLFSRVQSDDITTILDDIFKSLCFLCAFIESLNIVALVRGGCKWAVLLAINFGWRDWSKLGL